MIICLLVLVVSSGLGAALVRRLLDEDDPFLAWGSGCLAALLIQLGLTQLLRPLLGYGPSAIVSALFLVVLGTVCHRGLRPYRWPQWGRWQWAGLGLLWLLAYFVMHTHEVRAPEDDFFVHFPVISLLARGHYPPLNPFFAQLPLFGHFGRDLLISLLTHLNGDNILPATWALNHILQLASLALAAGLGQRATGPAGALLLPWFLFCGISVGSRAGLIDTYDNNNGLVYAGLLMLVHWLLRAHSSRAWATLGFLTGVYAIVYETHMLLFVALLALLSLLDPARRRGSALALAIALATASLMGGPVQDLAMRWLHLRQGQLGHVEAYQSQRVEIRFPKSHFLQINLGQDSYRRLSYVFETKILRPLAPPLDAGGYTFILSPRVLAIHWLGTWLGLWSILWIRGKDRCAAVLWGFAVLAFLVPAVVDFGPVHEKEYFRWEFAAGFGFSGALALALARQWNAVSKKWRGAVAMLALAVLWGGEMRINQAWIWVQREPERTALRRPWYPAQREWLLDQKDLHVQADEIDLATRLHARLGREDRVATDIDARGQWDFFREATLAGLLGCRVVGHQSPPRWMPDGIAPYFHSPNWSVIWQRRDPRALAGLEATWLFCTRPQEWLDGFCQGSERLNAVSAYRVPPTPPGEDPPNSLQVSALALPQGPTPQSEIAVPLEVMARNTGPNPIHWKGTWDIRCQGEKLDPNTHLFLNDSLELAPGEQRKVDLWFVPPLHQGPGRVQLLAGPAQMSEMEFTNPVQSVLAGLQLEEVRYTGREGEDNRALLLLKATREVRISGPVRLGWRIYDRQEHRYQTPYGLDGFETLELQLEPGQTREVSTKIRIPEPLERFRIDFFLWTYSGAEVPL